MSSTSSFCLYIKFGFLTVGVYVVSQAYKYTEYRRYRYGKTYPYEGGVLTQTHNIGYGDSNGKRRGYALYHNKECFTAAVEISHKAEQHAGDDRIYCKALEIVSRFGDIGGFS